MAARYERVTLGDVGIKLQTPGARRAAVLVHGWQGNFLTTWTRGANGFLEYLAETEPTWNYYSLRHTAGAFSPAAIRDVAGSVRTFLQSYVFPATDEVVLIAHSLGGLACRQAILDELDEHGPFELRVRGLLMFGTPNDGVSLGRAAGRFLASLSAAQMQGYSDTLRDLNARWLEQITNGGKPTSAFARRAKLLCWNVVGSADRVVTAASAAHLASIGDVKTVPKNHRTLVKPTSNNDVSVVIAAEFLRAASTQTYLAPRDRAIDVMAGYARKTASESPWVTKLEETITMTSLPEGDRKWFGRSDIYRCRVRTRRTGVECNGNICVGIRLNEASHEDGFRPDCDFAIGKGVLGNTVYDEIRKGVAAERLLELVTVESVEVTHGGGRLHFQPQPPASRQGAFRVDFKCIDMPIELKRVDEVVVTISTYVDLATGWYSFVSDDTAVERLEVTFQAPFESTCLHRVAFGPPLKLTENAVLDGLFSSSIVVNGPVAVGTRIDWIFER
jgi:pimeloyl-ACP methyl ester carboxylesterase